MDYLLDTSPIHCNLWEEEQVYFSNTISPDQTVSDTEGAQICWMNEYHRYEKYLEILICTALY